MTRPAVPELTQRFIATLHRLEGGEVAAVEAMAELFSDEAHIISAALRLADDERRGRDGARQFWSAYQRMVQPARSEFFAITTSDAAAGLFWTTHGQAQQSAINDYDGVSLLVFDEAGQIRLFRGYYDSRELEREVLPAATATDAAAGPAMPADQMGGAN